MRSCIKYLVIIGMVSVSSISAQNNYYGSDSKSNAGYKSNSGQTYQYDMNNASDRVEYSTDTDAQQRDMRSNMYDHSANIDRQIDRTTGQYGGGIYAK